MTSRLRRATLRPVVTALLSPGQGAQKPGFLSPWLDLPAAASTLAWWSHLTGLDLVQLGTAADQETITDTANTQPLLTAAALLAAREMPLGDVAIVAGHSVGELSAAAIGGAIAPESALGLAAARGRAMAAACALTPTGMSAVVGGVEADVLATIDALGLTPANRNGANQIVAAGPLERLAKLTENPPAKARVIPLKVAGAFHTEAMEPAREQLNQFAPAITSAHPHKIVLSNADGAAVSTGADAVARIVAQVTRPVRWDLVMRTLSDLGVTAIVELPPAGTLAGLAKRALPGVEVVTVNTPDDLAAAAELIGRHPGHASGEPHMPLIVAVAPIAGAFQPAEIEPGAALTAGTPLGFVQTRQGDTPVTAPRAGVFVDWLAHPDDPVAIGQPVAHLGLAEDRA